MKSLNKIVKNSEIFQELCSNISLLQNGKREIYGVIPSFKPYLLSALGSLAGRGLLWITSSWDNCEKLFESAYPFFTENARERFAVFPEFDEAGDRDITPALRMNALKLLSEDLPCYLIAPFKSILQKCEKPNSLKNDSIEFIRGESTDFENIIDRLERMGYKRNFQVERRGEYSRRGGILDIYPSAGEPVRIEFFGDEIDSVRLFDLDSQISSEKLQSVTIFPEREYSRDMNLLDFIPQNWIIVIDDPSVIKFFATDRNFGEEKDLWEQFEYKISNLNPLKVMSWSGDKTDSKKGINFNTQPVDAIGGNIEKLFENLSKWQSQDEILVISTQHHARLKKIAKEKGLKGFLYDLDKPVKPGHVLITSGDFAQGFYWKDENLRLITDKEILGSTPRRKRVLRTWDKTKKIDLTDLNPGDLVVHLSHGIGKFRGLAHLILQGTKRDFVELEYKKGDKLFVPIQQLDLLQKYIGPEESVAHLSRLGGSEWTKTRQKALAAAEDIADELLTLYAAREQTPGHAFPSDTPWQWEMEAGFPFEETPDQDKAISAVKSDMEMIRPMDRLLCGDAGYGKTEVALRAAFKATQDGKQVSMLTPTTILASQHYETFSQRLKPYPVEVAMLSRFKTQKEQKEIIDKLSAGQVDIVIGTHRLLQKDIEFKNLGLVIVDEEQHFGVKHTEKLKKLKTNVDVLTMTATPIPRTLNLGLSGIKDLSVIETAPEDRLPVKTLLYEFNPDLIRSVIIRELERGGQVYFLHNRVKDIEKIAQDIRRLVPYARIGVGHGQMDEHHLELLMLDFYDGNFDVLVCTTIIESGLDVPNANTIIINNAQNFGLSQLYQLRGRVGRSNHQAYAYLLYPPHYSLKEDAQKRLEVIRDFSHLGAGFQIAMKDLEIRGAGNILGAQQSGYIAAVGFELYCQMLKEAVDEKRGIVNERKSESPLIDLPVDSYIPSEYISDSQVKLEMYRKIARILKNEEIDEIKREFIDRFGPIPHPLTNLFEILKIKLLAWDLGAPSVKGIGGQVQILLPALRKLSHKEIQDIYDKTGAICNLQPPLLIVENLTTRVTKSLVPQKELESPSIWIPKLIKIMEIFSQWKNKKII